MQYPELAAEQLEYAVKTLGLRGASVGSVLGEIPSSEKYDPFWRKAEELDVPVFMHPTNADHIVQEKAFEGRGDLGNIIGNPFETTLFLTKLIFDGTLDRFPRLKVCGAHGAGYLPAYLQRTNVACEVRANAKCANTKTPADYLKTQILADSMVFSDEGLRHLVAEMGAGQIVVRFRHAVQLAGYNRYHRQCQVSRSPAKGSDPRRQPGPVAEGMNGRISVRFCAAFLAVICGTAAAPLTGFAASAANISGIWWATAYSMQIRPQNGAALPFTPAGAEAYRKNAAGLADGTLEDAARKYCVPDGVPRILATPYPFQIFESPGFVTIVYEQNHVFADNSPGPPGAR